MEWQGLLFPSFLILVRIAAFASVIPIFGMRLIPIPVRVTLAVTFSWFYLMEMGPPPIPETTHWVQAALMLLQEVVFGVALGLAVLIVFLSAQQAGFIMSQQIGFADAGAIDPVSNDTANPLALFIETVLILLLMAAGAHRLLVQLIFQSYEVFPVGSIPDLGALAEAIVRAGVTMFDFALQLAGPVVAGFFLVFIMLAILARAVPEMNVLFMSFPIRVAAGYYVAAMMLPTMTAFTERFARWVNGLVT